MAYGPARYIENLTVIPDQIGALGLNLAADIRQQRIGQVVLEAATVNGGIQAGADDRLPGHPLRHLAPVTVAQLRQFDVVWIERFARRVLSAFIWNTTSRENGSGEPFAWALDFRQPWPIVVLFTLAHLHEQSVPNLKLLGAVRLLRLLKQSKQLHIIKQIAFFIFANTLN